MLAVIIILFIIGIATLIIGFFIKENYEEESHSDEYLERILEERMNQVEDKLGLSAKMSASTIKKQTEKELEELSREKLSAVDQYSDKVMDRINKNHNEVMFLYGLLSDKQKELDETVEHLNKAQKQLEISNRLNMQKKEKESFEKIKESVFSTEENLDEEAETPDKEPVDKLSAIKALADKGLNDVEIAKKLSMGVGEVRLFLDLGKGV